MVGRLAIPTSNCQATFYLTEFQEGLDDSATGREEHNKCGLNVDYVFQQECQGQVSARCFR
eukprot:4420900-Amphidinium_carterae.1